MDFGFNNFTQYSRCDTVDTLVEHGCPRNQVVNPTGALRNIVDEALHDGADDEPNVQLRPQEVEIRIRPKSKARFFVTYRQARNYPVDLYYLMDLRYGLWGAAFTY